MTLFFEGSEKKLEIHVCQTLGDLRQLGRNFWHALVKKANADIISSIANDECDAYLLSESSLFVWHDRFVLLTCGNSTLVDAFIFFIDSVGASQIRFACYQRKSEFVSQLQASSFAEDLKLIKASIAGKAFRVGHLDSHHHYLFHTDAPFEDAVNDTTSELLMYHISGDMAQYLRSDRQTATQIRELLSLRALFPSFILDDHLFSPLGYSVNGIRGRYYFTIHISPQEQSAYVSIETNLPLGEYPQPIFADLLKLLMPRSWDIMSFNEKHPDEYFPAHLCLSTCSIATSLGYNIHFSHYQQSCTEVLIPEFI